MTPARAAAGTRLARLVVMTRLARSLLAFSLGLACGPTKPGEVPPLAPRPDPGLPKPSLVPGLPDPDKSPRPGPSLEPRDAGVASAAAPAAQPLRVGAAIDPAARGPDGGIGGVLPGLPPDAARPDAPPPPPPLPPLPDGGLIPDAGRPAP